MRLTRQASNVALDDPAERVANVLATKRDVFLAVHRHRLGREDLEDCLGQAALELVTRARAGHFAGDDHIANALEQKFLSRVADRQRALAGRSAIAAATHAAVRIGVAERDDEPAFDIAAADAEPSARAVDRERLQRVREVAGELTDDQRLVLACQVSLGIESAEFCRRFGWSPEKFKKVAQRARARLTNLVSEYEAGDRCRRLEADVLAYAANVASGAQSAAVREHLGNCVGCAAHVRGLRIASGRVAAVLPVPMLASHAMAAKVGLAAKLHGLWRALTAPVGRIAGSGASSIGAGGLAKAGLATVCIAAVDVGAHVTAKAPEAPQRAHAARTQVVAPRGATTTPVTAPSDLLRPTRSSRARTEHGGPSSRPTHSRHRGEPRRPRAVLLSRSRAATAPPPKPAIPPPPTTPPPAPPPPAASPPTAAGGTPSVRVRPPTAPVAPTAPNADSGTEFGVE